MTTGEEFQRYYEEAGPDYAAWSPAFNMHFGFFRLGMNPLNREAMLEQMNVEVLRRLDPKPGSHARFLDMGCGLGATLRAFARILPHADLQGITMVRWQADQAQLLNQSCGQAEHISIALRNYERTGYLAESFDGVYAIESSCYAKGANKAAFLREAKRLLRPGGRLVVSDGFLGPGKLRGPQKAVFRKLCECWVIDTLGEIGPFTQELERIGFRDVAVERIQARVAPSVVHVPWVTLKFLLATVIFGPRKMTRARWNNVLAPILLPFVGFPMGPMGYYIVSATRV